MTPAHGQRREVYVSNKVVKVEYAAVDGEVFQITLDRASRKLWDAHAWTIKRSAAGAMVIRGELAEEFRADGRERSRTIYMARTITGAGKGQNVTFANGDTLDLRRVNLKVDSCKNRGPRPARKLPRGISWHKRDGRFIARLDRKHGQKHLGCYRTIEEAVEARNRALSTQQAA